MAISARKLDLSAELARVERHIVRTETNITRQRAIVACLAQRGRDTEMPERVLRTLQESLATLQGYRQLILGESAAKPSR